MERPRQQDHGRKLSLGKSPFLPTYTHADLSILILCQTILIITILYPVVAIFVKATFLVFYMRIFSPVQRTVYLLWTGICTIVLFYVLTIVLYIYFTLPIGSEKHQPALLNTSVAQGVFSVITDFYILAVPIGSTLELHLSNRRKIGLCAVFATGLL